MICITEVKTFYSEQDETFIEERDNSTPFRKIGCDACNDVCHDAAEKELVRGRVFVNANGERVCIGMSSKVQNLIGLPFSIFESLKKEVDAAQSEISQLRTRNVKYQKRLLAMDTAGVFKRLKFLFTNRL